MRTCFKREGDAQKNATCGEGSRKRRKYPYFDQLLFPLPHPEHREMHINLSTQRNEDEGEANSSQEEEKERPRNVRKMKQTEISYEESLLQILRQKKSGRYRCRWRQVLVIVYTPISQVVWRRTEVSGSDGNSKNYATRQTVTKFGSRSLPSFSNANSFPPNSSHFASSPLNPQPVTSMRNSEILSRYLSSYSVEPQRPPTSTTVLPRYHTIPFPISNNAPLLPGEDGSSDVSSLPSDGATARL